MRKLFLLVATATFLLPNAYALPSFARQTGQRCGACHIGGNWPQLTPWGRFFKLAGYTPGKALMSKEGIGYVPLGVLGQVGVNWAPHPNDTQGNVLITQSGAPEAYGFTAELASKITDFAGVFAEYGISNTFPGWKGASGPIDIRATHFFHPGNNELLVGVDSNNDPTLQDVWNTVPSWGFPFYGAPQAPGAPGSPMIASLAQETGSIGAYALWNRQFYVELSMYRVGNGFFRFMNAGTSYQTGAQYLKGFNPYWRAYWTKDHGPNVLMVGTFGMRSNIYPDSGTPSGPTDLFTDTGFDAQYQHLGDTRKLTLRSSYIYEKQSWNASYPLGGVDNPHDNLKTLNLNGACTVGDGWTFSGGYFFSNGSGESAFAVSDPNLTFAAKPDFQQKAKDSAS